MISATQIDQSLTPQGMANLILPLLRARGIVQISGFSPDRHDLLQLGSLLGKPEPVPGHPNPGPILVQDRVNHPGAIWSRSTANIYQRLPSLEPMIEMDYCVKPSGFIRFYTDLCDCYTKYPAGILPEPTQIGLYQVGDGSSYRGEIIRKSRLTQQSYAAITDSLIAVDGPNPGRTAQRLVEAARNIYGFGTTELHTDQPGMLTISISDGVAQGRYRGSVGSGLGEIVHLLLAPNWEAIWGRTPAV